MAKHRPAKSNLVLASHRTPADAPSGHRSGWCSGDILDLYPGDAWFESVSFRPDIFFPAFLPGECQEHLHVVHVRIFPNSLLFFLSFLGWSETESTGTSATVWPIVPAPDDRVWCSKWNENWQGNRSTRRKPTPAPLCPPQIPHDPRLEYGPPWWEAGD
jgi:hypothetical protein